MSSKAFLLNTSIPSDQIIEPMRGDRKSPVKRKGQKDPTKANSKPRGSKPDDELVSKFLEGQTGPVTRGQVGAMAKLLGRTPKTVRAMMIRAREKFINKAERYVEIHGQATEDALTSGDHETAIKASQWAMQNLSAEGVRIVEKQETGPSGTKVMIGVQISGIETPTVLVKQIAPSTPLIEGETESESPDPI